MNEVGDTLERMTAVQLVAALFFVAGYVLALGQLATERGRRWGALTAAAASTVFVVFTRPWEHGVILVVLASAVVAVLVAMAWAFNVYFERRQAALLAQLAAAAAAQSQAPGADDAAFNDPQRGAAPPATSHPRPPVREPASSH